MYEWKPKFKDQITSELIYPLGILLVLHVLISSLFGSRKVYRRLSLFIIFMSSLIMQTL
jgi:hypothetical protein